MPRFPDAGTANQTEERRQKMRPGLVPKEGDCKSSVVSDRDPEALSQNNAQREGERE